MNYKLWTRYEPCMVEVVINTTQPVMMVMKVFDASQANTVFMDTEKTVKGEESFFVRMPLAPNNVTLSLYNKENGNLLGVVDNTFKVKSIKKKEIEITLGLTKMDIPIVRNFIAFSQKFAYNAGWLADNKDYYSSVGSFKIEYLPHIVSLRTNEKMATPARISTKNGRIQVSKEAFVNFTIPMRMAILLHEFSHFYINTDVSNEVEADLNALTIYLGLGYPIKEAYSAFGETFIGYPTQQNKERFDIIDKFIRDYIKEYKIKEVYATGTN